MQLPTTIKIGPIQYSVKLERDLHTFTPGWTKEFLNGHIIHSDAAIKINSGLHDTLQLACLVHEALHAILFHAAQEHEERTVEALAYGIVALLQDNPDVVKLFEEE